MTTAEAVAYLKRYGYIKSPAIAKFSFGLHKAFAPDYRPAILSFQLNFGLPVTGELDSATSSFMERPRCGFPDVGSFVLQGNKWPTNSLTYRFFEVTSDLPAAGLKQSIADAFKLWSDAANLTFTLVNGGADIDIRFVTGEHGDGVPFDGPSGILAHAYFPMPGIPIAGDAHFDDNENWATTDLVTVAAHEFGHSLGLAHSMTQGALMYPYYSGPHRFLHQDDVDGSRALYGAAVPVPAPPPPVPPTDPNDLSDRLARNLTERIYTAKANGRTGPWGGPAADIFGKDGTQVDLTQGIEVF